MTMESIADHVQPSSTLTSTHSRERTWEDVHAKVRNSIVAIECTHPFAFGASTASNSNATGFVVDSNLGIILSNRHVMGTGPGIHRATFDTNEFVYLQPLHYDPIHDFAFFRYDPAALKHTTPKSIKLFSGGARPGVPFQMIGNASGEKMTVCSGTLSQVNRNTPSLKNEQDANTFYCQASTTSAGGASGSPVLDINGNAIALNVAKINGEGASFFVPLDRIVYSLEYIRRGKQVPRGTVQAVFVFETYEEVQRLGLPEKQADSSRLATPKSEGMLVIDTILRRGPADGALETGDIVISLNGTPISDFAGLESALDANVNSTVDFVVSRKGELVPVTIHVQDMYDVTPMQLLSIGFATFHNMSLMLASKSSIETSGVYIAAMSEELLPRAVFQDHRVIVSANGTPTPNLKALFDVFRTVPVGQPMVIKAVSVRNNSDYIVVTVKLPDNNGPFRLLTRSSESGFWSEERIELCYSSSQDNIGDMANSLSRICLTGSQLQGRHASLDRIWQSIVIVSVSTDVCMDEHVSGTVHGTGFVIDKVRGIVVCSAATFCGSAANISITICNTLRVAATVVYVHPLCPLVFLKFDPADFGSGSSDLVSDLPIDSNYWSGERRLAVGQDAILLSSNRDGTPQLVQTHISDRYLYDNGMVCTYHPFVSYFNTDFVDTDAARNAENMSGVLCSTDGYAMGLWIQLPRCCYDHLKNSLIGLDISYIRKITEALRSSDEYPDIVRTLNAVFAKIRLSTARDFGLSNYWISKLTSDPTGDNCVFQAKQKDIKNVAEGSGVEVGDIILTIDGKLVRHIDDVAIVYEKSKVDLVLLRQGQELSVTVNTVHPHETKNRHLLRWCGLSIQDPFVEICRLAVSVPSQCLINAIYYGTSAWPLYGKPLFITEVNDEKVRTMDDLVQLIRKLKVDNSEFNTAVAAGNLGRRITTVPGRDVKLRLVNLKGKVSVHRFRTDDHYSLAWQMVRGNGTDTKWRWEAI